MNCFIINNITENDVSTNKLRILIENKSYFSAPDDRNPHNYDVKIKVGSEIYDRQYRYTRDKSGILKLRAKLYKEILQIRFGDKLVVVVLEKDRMYQIINVRTKKITYT